jgi:hypothetical protein
MQTYTVDIAGEPVKLPIVPINQKLAISLLMVIDMGVRFGERIGGALAQKLRPLKPDIVVGAATLGIPVVIEVSRALGLDDYVIAQKSLKIHLADALMQELESVTSAGKQRLMLDRRAAAAGGTARGDCRRRRRHRLKPCRDFRFGPRGRRADRRRRRDPDGRPRLEEDARRRRVPGPGSGAYPAICAQRRQGNPNAGHAVTAFCRYSPLSTWLQMSPPRKNPDPLLRAACAFLPQH